VSVLAFLNEWRKSNTVYGFLGIVFSVVFWWTIQTGKHKKALLL
jgi:hypothetical protein